MSFDIDRKRTPEEIRKSLLACAEVQCEQCSFYEADTPRGYSPCHEWLLYTQAAEYIWELMVLKNKENSSNRVFIPDGHTQAKLGDKNQ